MTAERLRHTLNGDQGRLIVHHLAFIGIYTLYGYQVCPFLDTLKLAEIMIPTAIAAGLHFAARSVWVKRARRLPITARNGSIFRADFALFVIVGLLLGAFNFAVFGFPAGSGAKVIFGFGIFGLYIALDLALRRDIVIAKDLRAQGESFPMDDQFMPYQTKFMLFSGMNIAIVGIVSLMVAMKDLIWAQNTALDETSVQLYAFLNMAAVVGVLCGYIVLVVRQYSRKIDFSLTEETTVLQAVREGALDARVGVLSNDEFGHLAHLTNHMIDRLQSSMKEISQSQGAIIRALVDLAAKRDNETGLHLKRTQTYVRVIAEAMRRSGDGTPQLDDGFIAMLERAAPLHDIGKVGIPDAVLQKPGRLTAEEFAVMRNHAAIGADALREADRMLGGSPFIRMALEIAESHHERWDGAGYPHGLREEEIPLAARIMAVSDVYDAVRSKRVYKPAMPHDEAVGIIRDGAGTQFDPLVVAAFLQVEGEIAGISEQLSDDDPVETTVTTASVAA
ncbi:MAG: HD domain-containing phosphohydrolase [Pseudomonadota bacterium]